MSATTLIRKRVISAAAIALSIVYCFAGSAFAGTIPATDIFWTFENSSAGLYIVHVNGQTFTLKERGQRTPFFQGKIGKVTFERNPTREFSQGSKCTILGLDAPIDLKNARSPRLELQFNGAEPHTTINLGCGKAIVNTYTQSSRHTVSYYYSVSLQ